MVVKVGGAGWVSQVSVVGVVEWSRPPWPGPASAPAPAFAQALFPAPPRAGDRALPSLLPGPGERLAAVRFAGGTCLTDRGAACAAALWPARPSGRCDLHPCFFPFSVLTPTYACSALL